MGATSAYLLNEARLFLLSLPICQRCKSCAVENRIQPAELMRTGRLVRRDDPHDAALQLVQIRTRLCLQTCSGSRQTSEIDRLLGTWASSATDKRAIMAFPDKAWSKTSPNCLGLVAGYQPAVPAGESMNTGG
jgi:hypothetical protein